jgi:hypothetical protein
VPDPRCSLYMHPAEIPAKPYHHLTIVGRSRMVGGRGFGGLTRLPAFGGSPGVRLGPSLAVAISRNFKDVNRFSSLRSALAHFKSSYVVRKYPPNKKISRATNC